MQTTTPSRIGKGRTHFRRVGQKSAENRFARSWAALAVWHRAQAEHCVITPALRAAILSICAPDRLDLAYGPAGRRPWRIEWGRKHDPGIILPVLENQLE